MIFFHTFGIITALFLLLKITWYVVSLLFVYFGRRFGFGVKYSSDNGEFVVITGATGTIGSEFVKEFASMGYNLMLISRNSDKLDLLEQHVRTKYKTIKHILKIPADFTNIDCYNIIRQKLSKINPIVALVNCTGYCLEPKKFWKHPSHLNRDIVLVNVLAPLMMMNILMPRFIAQNRGIIINLGSQSGDFRFPKYSTFSASKSFIHTLSEIVSTECYGTNVYVQTVKPCFTSASSKNLRSTFFKIPPKNVAYTSLMTLGFESSTYGHWKHRLTALLLNTLVFIVGHRLTTTISGFFISFYVQISHKDKIREASDTTLASGEQSTSPSPSSSRPSNSLSFKSTVQGMPGFDLLETDDLASEKLTYLLDHEKQNKIITTDSSSKFSPIPLSPVNESPKELQVSITPPCIKWGNDQEKKSLDENQPLRQLEVICKKPKLIVSQEHDSKADKNGNKVNNPIKKSEIIKFHIMETIPESLNGESQVESEIIEMENKSAVDSILPSSIIEDGKSKMVKDGEIVVKKRLVDSDSKNYDQHKNIDNKHQKQNS